MTAQIIYDIRVGRNGQLQSNGMVIQHGLIVEIPPAAAGRRRFILLSKKSVPLDLVKVSKEDVMVQSNAFKHYYLKQGENVVGSMLDVSARFCTYNNHAVLYTKSGELKDFHCPTEYQSGGLLIYQDGHGSFAAIPAKEIENSLVVKDRVD